MEHQLVEMNKSTEFSSMKSRKLSDSSIPSSIEAQIISTTSSSSTSVTTAAYRFSNSHLSDYMAKLHMDQS